MTNFDVLTASPEVLGAFLGAICTGDGNWDHAFQKTYCKHCTYDDCPDLCPHEEHRNNPVWWLGLEVKKDVRPV